MRPLPTPTPPSEPHSEIARAPRAGARLLLAALAAFSLGSCSDEPDLVVYISLDEVFSRPLIAEFEKETGLDVRAEYDIEASKTVGHVRRLREEKDQPRCDIFWNNEVAQTVRLSQEGLLAPYDSPSAADIPEMFRDPDRRWTGFAARARILIVNTDLVEDPSVITGMNDMLKPEWRGKTCIARPLTGTTLTHATALYDAIGEEAAEAFLSTIAEGSTSDDPPVHVASSNGQTAGQVASGEMAWGWTDTDDFAVKLEQGNPVAAVYPDQEPGPDGKTLGTLLIPNTVCMLKGAPHAENAKKFIDWVLSREVEEKLAFARSAQIPVREDVPRPDHVRSDFAVMQISYQAIGQQIAARTEHLRDLFLQ